MDKVILSGVWLLVVCVFGEVFCCISSLIDFLWVSVVVRCRVVMLWLLWVLWFMFSVSSVCCSCN